MISTLKKDLSVFFVGQKQILFTVKDPIFKLEKAN